MNPSGKISLSPSLSELASCGSKYSSFVVPHPPSSSSSSNSPSVSNSTSPSLVSLRSFGSITNRRSRRSCRHASVTSPLFSNVVVTESTISPCHTPKTSALVESVSSGMSELHLDADVALPLSRQNRSVSNYDLSRTFSEAFSNVNMNAEPMQVDCSTAACSDITCSDITCSTSTCSTTNCSTTNCSTSNSVIGTPLLFPMAEHIDNDEDDLLCSGSHGALSPCFKNLPHPPSLNIPSRSESSMCLIGRVLAENENEAAESPLKFPRFDGSIGQSSRTQGKATEDDTLLERRKRFGGPLSSSTSSLPTPVFSPPVVEYNEEVVHGMKVMVKIGKDSYKRISRECAADFIRGKIKLPVGHSLLIWDARFPFEFVSHIKGAENKTYPNLRGKIDDFVRESRMMDRRHVILCYCQFSSARAPKLVDILRVAEKDIMLEERMDRSTLESSEESRFIPFIIDGGFDNFYDGFHGDADFCEGGEYVKEIDDKVNGPRCRAEYEDDIMYACNSRVLGDDNNTQGDCGNSQDSCHPVKLSKKKTRSFCFSPGFSISHCGFSSENEDDSNNTQSQDTSMDSFDFEDEEPDLSSQTKSF